MNYKLHFAYPDDINRFMYRYSGENDLRARIKSKLTNLLKEKYDITAESFTIRYKHIPKGTKGPNAVWLIITLNSSDADDIKIRKFCEDVIWSNNEASDLFELPESDNNVREYHFEKI